MLPLKKADPRRWTHEDACAHPITVSPVFTIRAGWLRHVWVNNLELHKGRDLLLDNGKPWSEEDIKLFLKNTLTRKRKDSQGRTVRETRYYLGDKSERTASEKAFLDSWRSILAQIPLPVHRALRKIDSELWRYSEQARSMMSDMGWHSGPLGARREGITQPVEPGKPNNRLLTA